MHASPQSGDEAASTSGQQELALDDLEDLGIIGSGSSGVAKKVRHRPTDKLLVLKVIQFDVSSDVIRKQASTHWQQCAGRGGCAPGRSAPCVGANGAQHVSQPACVRLAAAAWVLLATRR